MALIQKRSKRKITGGRYKKLKIRRSAQMGKAPILTKIGSFKRKLVRVLGGNTRLKCLESDFCNLLNPKTKKFTKAKINNVIENSANRNYIRRNILTKGAVIETDKGKAKITNRPGQEGSINAVLIE